MLIIKHRKKLYNRRILEMTADDYNELLLQKRVITLFGPVDEQMSNRVVGSLVLLNAQSQEPIRLTIKSHGGQYREALEILDAVRTSSSPVIGTVYGEALSNAALILQACKLSGGGKGKRLATKHSKLLIHCGTTDSTMPLAQLLDEQKRAQMIQAAAGKAEKLIGLVVDILAETTGKTKEDVRSKLLEDREMAAEEALEFGLVDEII